MYLQETSEMFIKTRVFVTASFIMMNKIRTT